MTRVYVLFAQESFTVPEAWTFWIYRGMEFRRVDGIVMQRYDGTWMRAHSEHVPSVDFARVA